MADCTYSVQFHSIRTHSLPCHVACTCSWILGGWVWLQFLTTPCAPLVWPSRNCLRLLPYILPPLYWLFCSTLFWMYVGLMFLLLTHLGAVSNCPLLQFLPCWGLIFRVCCLPLFLHMWWLCLLGCFFIPSMSKNCIMSVLFLSLNPWHSLSSSLHTAFDHVSLIRESSISCLYLVIISFVTGWTTPFASFSIAMGCYINCSFLEFF